MTYHGRVIGPGGRVYLCEHNHRTETAAITCGKSSRTRQMAALVWQRAAAQEALAAKLARERKKEREAARALQIEVEADAAARRAAAQAAAEQARADKRAAKLAAMSPQRAWKRMTPAERLLHTADLEMEAFGEIKSPDAKAAYDARAAKRATPVPPPSSNPPKPAGNVTGTMKPNGRVRPSERRNVQAKKEAAQGAMGCLLLLVIVVIAVVVVIHRSGPSGPALTIMKQIPGCTGITTNGGDSFDDNTVSEGSCTLADGTHVRVYVWFDGDTSEQHDYVYQNASNCSSSSSSTFSVPDGCFVGSNPQPWFIDVATSSDFSTSGAQSDWAAVEDGLSVTPVTNVPLSWCSNFCPVPGQPSHGGGFSFGDHD
jgi:hypothetical protein